MRFLFFYTHSLEAKYGFLAIPCVELAYSQTSYFLLEIVQCSYGNRNRGRLLSAGPRVGLFKCRFILDYEQKMHTSSRVMETNPPGANRPLTNLAQSCSYSVKASRATLLFWVTSNFKSNTMMVVKVHETFDFPEIESVTILCFYLKVSKKRWSWFESAIRRSFLGESQRTHPKQKGKKDRLIAG